MTSPQTTTTNYFAPPEIVRDSSTHSSDTYWFCDMVTRSLEVADMVTRSLEVACENSYKQGRAEN